LKPTHANARRFVLTPLASGPAEPGPRGAIAVGVGQVKTPDYLNKSSLAIRRGTNEIDYLPLILWAERVDNGLQRVLAENLARLLPTDKIRLSAWRSDEVSVEAYIMIEQFDVDAHGHGVLSAYWRVLSPGGDKTLKLGDCHLARQGPLPDSDPSGAVGTLSGLVEEFSRQLAEAIKENAGAGHH
jgi:uncharacterized lipoprotein YmbA